MAAGNNENPETTLRPVGRLKNAGLSKTQPGSPTKWGHVNGLHENLRYSSKLGKRKTNGKMLCVH